MTWPRVFHRIWLDEEERPEFKAWRVKLEQLHPRWEIRTWGDSDEAREVVPESLLPYWDRYIVEDPYGRIPDILRYALLWKFGGVYIDTDFEPLKPFDELLEDKRPFLGWEDDRRLCTAVFGAPKAHPAIAELLERLPDSLIENVKDNPTVASGPGYATPLLRDRDDVRRLPVGVFYPVGWWERELLGEVEYPEQTIAVHHWAKGWG